MGVCVVVILCDPMLARAIPERLRDKHRPKTGFTCSAENENGAENEISFSEWEFPMVANLEKVCEFRKGFSI